MKTPQIKTTPASKSKYDLTLSEFPLFILSKSSKKKIKHINYKDKITGKGGQSIVREWTVSPHGNLGFGTASTFSTLFELFQIWKEQNFDSQTIYFESVYNLLKRTERDTGSKEYKQIIRDLDCLVGITIKAKNAFWDNELKAYVDRTFHLFDHVYLFKEKPNGKAGLPFAQIKSSDILYGSVLKNSFLITGFDSKFFHNLLPIEQRLSLYLAKMFRSQTFHKRELLEFAKQIPLQVKEKKYIKRQLDKTCKGLILKGFTLLKSFNFEKGEGKNEYVVFKRSEQVPKLFFNHTKAKRHPGKEPHEAEVLVEDILEICQDEKSTNFYKRVAALLPREVIYRGLSEVKETRDIGEIKKSKGALFTCLIKRYAKERGIEL